MLQMVYILYFKNDRNRTTKKLHIHQISKLSRLDNNFNKYVFLISIYFHPDHRRKLWCFWIWDICKSMIRCSTINRADYIPTSNTFSTYMETIHRELYCKQKSDKAQKMNICKRKTRIFIEKHNKCKNQQKLSGEHIKLLRYQNRILNTPIMIWRQKRGNNKERFQSRIFNFFNQRITTRLITTSHVYNYA